MEAVLTAPEQTRTFTLEAYLAREERAVQKHLFMDGIVLPVPGKTYHAVLVASNVAAALSMVAKSLAGDFPVLGSRMKIMIEKYRQVVYPDALVISGKPAFYQGRKDVILNPLVIVEVLSRSTEAYDFGDKFVRYASIPGFREYILLAQDEPEATCFFQEEPGLWRQRTVSGADALLEFRALNTSIRLSEVYDGVDLAS